MRCLDCKIDTGGLKEFYIVKDEVWLNAVPDKRGYLCIGCLEKRLGRQLTYDDFTVALINAMNWHNRSASSERLWARMSAGAPTDTMAAQRTDFWFVEQFAKRVYCGINVSQAFNHILRTHCPGSKE